MQKKLAREKTRKQNTLRCLNFLKDWTQKSKSF